MNMKLIYMIFLFSFFLPLGAQNRIDAIEVSGLERTTEKTILNIIKVGVGDPVTETLVTDVEQRLRKAGIFQEEISVNIINRSDALTLSIDLRDRWTLVGLPFFSYDDGDLSGGAFLFDSNLMGKQQIMVASAIYQGDDGITSFVYFKDPTIFDSEQSGALALVAGNPRVTLTDLSGETVWEDYMKTGVTLAARGGKEFSDSFNLEAALRGALYTDERGKTAPPRADESYMALGLVAKAAYDSRFVYPLFSQGLEGVLESEFMWEPQGDVSLSVKGKSSYSQVLGETLLLKASIEGGATNSDFHSLFLLGGSPGSSTLPSKGIGTDLYSNVELLAETRALKIKYGSITLPIYYEGGILSDYNDESQFYHGIGGGMRFYLAKVAFPAMGMDYVYNFTSGYSGFSFYIGMVY